ncbi:winged helix-turn-helix domain-containing protein [Chloroflexota bacterium]
MSEWTFITSHAIVLSIVSKQPLITARELAIKVDATERAIRRIIADLYDEGYINKKRIGRRVRYRINPAMTLRHPSHHHIAITDFLKALRWKQRAHKWSTPATEGHTTKTRKQVGEFTTR